MNTDYPLFSILIPVYNTSKYLCECLDSVLNQTFTDWEAICVNDASTDNSLEILQKYAEKDPRIKIINHEYNKNLYAARSTGIQAAHGKYVAFLDSDDFLHPTFLETGKKLIESDDYLFVQMGFHAYGLLRRPKIYSTISKTISPEEFLYGGLVSQQYAFMLWGILYRTELLKNTDIAYPRSMCDGEDMLRLVNLLVHSDGTFKNGKIRIATQYKMYFYRYGAGMNRCTLYSFQSYKKLITKNYAYKQILSVVPDSMRTALSKKYGPQETVFYSRYLKVLLEQMETKEDFIKSADLFCDVYGHDVFYKYLADCHIVCLKCGFSKYLKEAFFFLSLAVKHIGKTIINFFMKIFAWK